MRVGYIIDNQGNEYTCFMGSGVEIQRLVKKAVERQGTL